MNQAIATIIKDQIDGLSFIDKIAGLVSTTYMTIDGVQKAFPVACCVTADDCKAGAYNDLTPDSKYKTVIYFEDEGVSFKESRGNYEYYTSNLRLVCWINVQKLLNEGCLDCLPCSVSATIISKIVKSLAIFPANIPPMYQVLIKVMGQEIRSNSIFAKYTFNELQTQYLMSPYDYFALNIQTTFAICVTEEDEYPECCEPT